LIRPNRLGTLGVTFAASFLAVTLAYAPIVAMGYWDRNVLAFGTNGLGAVFLTLVTLVADRTRRPFLVHLGFAVPLLAIYLAGMVTLFPPTSWVYWVPLYFFIALAWGLVNPIRRALSEAPPTPVVNPMS